MYQSLDGSIASDDLKKILFFSADKFYEEIYLNDNCFICGANPSNKKFNDEHILPKWILKKYKLFSSQITLSNEQHYRYDRYKIPCCEECNKLYGKIVETPISDGFSHGYNHACTFYKKHYRLIFIWLTLIFLKTHLKDKKFKFDPKKKTSIGDIYEWEKLHHLHCISRIPYTKNLLGRKAIGSMLLVPAKKIDLYPSFDFIDIYEGQTIFIRMDEIAIICVLNDSCSIINSLSDLISKFSGPLDALQLRELAVKFAYMNMKLQNRPDFFSQLDGDKNQITIDAKTSGFYKIGDTNLQEYGRLFYHFSKDILKDMGNPDLPIQISNIKKGLLTYLLDDKGNFQKESIKIVKNQQVSLVKTN